MKYRRTRLLGVACAPAAIALVIGCWPTFDCPAQAPPANRALSDAHSQPPRFGASRSVKGMKLKVSPKGRYFVAQDGKPFFYLGDTAWLLFQRLDRGPNVRIGNFDER
jgi:hypothetical protein